MKGKYGTAMNSIEYRHNNSGNRKCSECAFLKYGVIGRGAGYYCTKKNKPRYYTSKCYCELFDRKDPKIKRAST